MNGRESAVIGTGPVTRGTGENWGGAVCANAVLPTSKTSKARRQVRMRLTARRCPSARGLRVIVNRLVERRARILSNVFAIAFSTSGTITSYPIHYQRTHDRTPSSVVVAHGDFSRVEFTPLNPEKAPLRNAYL